LLQQEIGAIVHPEDQKCRIVEAFFISRKIERANNDTISGKKFYKKMPEGNS
jgi:hypothetical protein